MLILVQLTVNYMVRKILGGRCAIHVMTGQKPNTVMELALWMGNKLKDASVIETNLGVVEKYCKELATAVADMHEQIKDVQLKEARSRARREAKNKFKGAYAFAVGDLVMVAAHKNAANIVRKSKAMVKWQGPYQIVKKASVTEFDVLLLGDPMDRVKPVHWTRIKKFAGPEFATTVALTNRAQHDRQKFYIDDMRDWRMLENGAIEILVKWRGFEETWEPALELCRTRTYPRKF